MGSLQTRLSCLAALLLAGVAIYHVCVTSNSSSEQARSGLTDVPGPVARGPVLRGSVEGQRERFASPLRRTDVKAEAANNTKSIEITLTEDGAALPGIRVAPWVAVADGRVLGTVHTSDAQGRVIFEFDAQQYPTFVLLDPSLYVAESTRDRTSGRIVQIRWRVARSSPLTVDLQDAYTDAPLPQATVTCTVSSSYVWRGKSDAEGRLQVPLSPSAPQCILMIEADGYDDTRRTVKLPFQRSRTKPITLRLRPRRFVQGRVLHDTGAPASGVQVYGTTEQADARWRGWAAGTRGRHWTTAKEIEAARERLPPTWRAEAPTDEHGRYRIWPGPTEASVVFRSRQDGALESHGRRAANSASITDVVLSRDQAASLCIEFSSNDGSHPYGGKGARLQIVGVAHDVSRKIPRGLKPIEVGPLAPGPYLAILTIHNLSISAHRLDLGPGANHIRLTIPPARQIRGRVVDASGRSAPGAAVFLWRGRLRFYNQPWVVADEEGVFVFEALPERDYWIQAGAKSVTPDGDVFQRTPRRRVTAPATELVLVARPRGEVRMTLVDADGELARGTALVVYHGTNSKRFTAELGSGRASIGKPDPGTELMTVSVAGCGPCTVPYPRVDSEIVDLGTIHLSEGLPFQVVVVDGDGAPVRDARVRIEHSDVSALSNARGVVSFSEAPESACIARIYADGFEPRHIQLPNDRPNRLTCHLARTHVQAGRALVSDSQAAPRGAKLHFDACPLALAAPFEEPDRRTSSALIGAEGSFLAVVGAGCWRVELELPHGDRLDMGTWVVGDTPSSGTTLRPLMVR